MVPSAITPSAEETPMNKEGPASSMRCHGLRTMWPCSASCVPRARYTPCDAWKSCTCVSTEDDVFSLGEVVALKHPECTGAGRAFKRSLKDRAADEWERDPISQSTLWPSYHSSPDTKVCKHRVSVSLERTRFDVTVVHECTEQPAYRTRCHNQMCLLEQQKHLQRCSRRSYSSGSTEAAGF